MPRFLCSFYEAFAKFLPAKIFILVTFILKYMTLPVKFKSTITRFHLTWWDQLSMSFDQNWIDFYHLKTNAKQKLTDICVGLVAYYSHQCKRYIHSN